MGPKKLQISPLEPWSFPWLLSESTAKEAVLDSSYPVLLSCKVSLLARERPDESWSFIASHRKDILLFCRILFIGNTLLGPVHTLEEDYVGG